MKNTLLFSLFILVLGLSSCAKDSNDSQTEFESFVNQSEITVSVSHQLWSDCYSNMGCDGTGLSYIISVPDAVVTIFRGDQTSVDDSGFERETVQTNNFGTFTFSDLEPAEYTIIVNSEYGEETRVVQTIKNISKLEIFRF